MKKWTAMLLLLVCLCGMAGCARAEMYTSGSYRYTPLDDGTVKISSFLANGVRLCIPDTLAGKRVSAIGINAFWGNNTLTDVTIPDGVVSIGYYAFEYCSGMTSVHFPASLTYIGDCAFNECSSLTDIRLCDGVISIGEGAFAFCESLKSAVIPDSVEFIGKGAFWECNDLTITVGRGSYAEQYAKDNSIPYIYSVR